MGTRRINIKFTSKLFIKIIQILCITLLFGSVFWKMKESFRDFHKQSKTEFASQPLILLWNGYQEHDEFWSRVFHKITSGQCPHTCGVTRDKSRVNQSSALVFHLPNLHWENYNYPEHRDPSVPWVLMTYESANSVRERSGNWGRYPALTGRRLNNVFNRTMTLRHDSDVVARHGLVSRRQVSLTHGEMESLYSQENSRDFSNYTKDNFKSKVGNSAPIVWFVSHCHDYNGRMKYVRLLQRYIGVDIYGDCGDKRCGHTRSMGTRYRADNDPCFDLVNTNYKFYLSFENALCNDYVTEKAFNALKLNTIPIMFGGGDYDHILPPHSHINALHYPDPRDLADHLYSLLHDDDKYNSYFNWRPYYDVVTYESVPDNCDLCTQLVTGQLDQYHTYPDMWAWLVKQSGCVFTKRSWSTDKFREVWKSFSLNLT